MDQRPPQPGPHYLSLSCERPGIEIEFDLKPGTFVRFGSAEEMEVVLPFSGVEPQALRLDRDAAGNLIATDAKGTYVVTGNTSLRLGPHFFQLRTGKKPVPSPVPPRPIPPPSVPAVFEKRQPLPPPRSRPARRSAAGWVLAGVGAVALAVTGMVVFQGKRDAEAGAQKAAAVKQNLQPGLVRELDPMPVVKPGALPPEPDLKPETAVASIPSPPPPPPPANPHPEPEKEPGKSHSASREVVNWKTIASEVKDSVFLLKTRMKDGEFAQGTAFRIKPQGFLVTNAHVVKGGYAFETTSENGEVFRTSRVRHFDEEHDLAVLEWEGPPDAPGLQLSAGGKPNVGEPVGVYGNPQGMRGTFSEGTLSAFRQAFEIDRPRMGELIQMTAPISQGSSGSPVLNTGGEVIGIATLLLKSGQNINFAIPVAALTRLLREEPLPSREFVTRGSGLRESPPETSFRKALSPDEFREVEKDYEKLKKDLLARDWNPALRMAKKLVTLNPDSSFAHLGVGLASHGLSRYMDAEAALARSVELAPRSAMGREYLVRTRMLLKKWNEASLDLLALGELDLPVAESLLRDARATFGDDSPGLNGMARAFEARFPPEAPEALAARLISRFLRAAEGPDVNLELRTYADSVGLYYKDGVKADSHEVLEDLKKFRRKWATRKYSLDKIEKCRTLEKGAALLIRYSYRYNLSGAGGKRNGVVQQEILFGEAAPDEWVVIGIRAMNRKED